MKKQYILIIIIIFLHSNITIGQLKHAKITYKVKMYKKDPNKKSSEMVAAMIEESENLKMELIFKNNNSTFDEVKSMEIDDKRKNLRKLAKVVTGLSSCYYYDLKNRTIIREKEFDGLNYNITSKFNNVKWKLINETKNIMDYKCQKAVTTKTYTSRKGNIINLEVIAWYTTDIPIPLGPKNYVGLPGLVLELNEGKNKTYYASKINLNPKEKILLKIPEKGKIVTEEKYTKIIKGSTNAWINSMKN